MLTFNKEIVIIVIKAKGADQLMARNESIINLEGNEKGKLMGCIDNERRKERVLWKKDPKSNGGALHAHTASGAEISDEVKKGHNGSMSSLKIRRPKLKRGNQMSSSGESSKNMIELRGRSCNRKEVECIVINDDDIEPRKNTMEDLLCLGSSQRVSTTGQTSLLPVGRQSDKRAIDVLEISDSDNESGSDDESDADDESYSHDESDLMDLAADVDKNDLTEIHNKDGQNRRDEGLSQGYRDKNPFHGNYEDDGNRRVRGDRTRNESNREVFMKRRVGTKCLEPLENRSKCLEITNAKDSCRKMKEASLIVNSTLRKREISRCCNTESKRPWGNVHQSPCYDVIPGKRGGIRNRIKRNIMECFDNCEDKEEEKSFKLMDSFTSCQGSESDSSLLSFTPEAEKIDESDEELCSEVGSVLTDLSKICIATANEDSLPLDDVRSDRPENLLGKYSVNQKQKFIARCKELKIASGNQYCFSNERFIERNDRKIGKNLNVKCRLREDERAKDKMKKERRVNKRERRKRRARSTRSSGGRLVRLKRIENKKLNSFGWVRECVVQLERVDLDGFETSYFLSRVKRKRRSTEFYSAEWEDRKTRVERNAPAERKQKKKKRTKKNLKTALNHINARVLNQNALNSLLKLEKWRN